MTKNILTMPLNSWQKITQFTAKTILCLILLISVQNTRSTAQCLTNSLTINTGYDPNTATALAPSTAGTVDPHWTVSSLSAGNSAACGGCTGPNAYVIPPLVLGVFSWYTTATSGWISFKNATGYPTTTAGIYSSVFSRTFNTCATGVYNLNLSISDDNWITSLTVDGISTGFSQSNVTTNFTGHANLITSVNLSSCGTHTISVTVFNESKNFPLGPWFNAYGLRINGTVSSASGVPSILMETSACAGHPCLDPITGPATVCVGSTITLHDATTGGTWSTASTNISLAACSSPSDIAVTGITAGTATVTYTFGCSVEIYTITVLPLPDAGTITASDVCVGSTVTETTSGDPGGTWSSSNTSLGDFASSSIGDLTGYSAGIITITYTVSNSCGTAFSTATLNVLALPDAGVITATDVCVGSTVTEISSGDLGGTWSSSNTSLGDFASSSLGDLTGYSAGVITITYTVTNSCGTAFAIATLNVLPLPDAGIVTATDVCVGSTLTETSSGDPGGTWSSSNTSLGDFASSSIGDLTGYSAGVITITYTVTNSCGTAFATATLNVLPLPDAGIITAANVCVGSVVTQVSSGDPGGTWSSSDPTKGDFTVSTIGDLTGYSAGIITITYTVTNSCGTAIATETVNVLPLPDAGIIIATNPCIGSFATEVSSGDPGGIWTSGNPGVADFVSFPGDLTGINAGLTTITYTVTNSCGTAFTTAIISVDVTPTACITYMGGDNFLITCTPAGTVFYNLGAFYYTGACSGCSYSATYCSGSVYVVGSAIVTCPGAFFGSISGGMSTNGCPFSVSCSSGANSGSPKPGVTNSAQATGSQGINIVPNPSTGIISINGTVSLSGTVSQANVEITDVLGKVVFNSITTIENGQIPGTIQLDNSVPNGVYIVKVKSGDQENVSRFVLSR